MKTQELTIEGMTCNHCVMAVKKELANVPGITIQSVEIGKAKIQYDETKVSQADIANAIENAGYTLNHN